MYKRSNPHETEPGSSCLVSHFWDSYSRCSLCKLSEPDSRPALKQFLVDIILNICTPDGIRDKVLQSFVTDASGKLPVVDMVVSGDSHIGFAHCTAVENCVGHFCTLVSKAVIKCMPSTIFMSKKGTA